jgi:hypothetical protein
MTNVLSKIELEARVATLEESMRLLILQMGGVQENNQEATESNMSATVATPPSTKSQTKYSPIRSFLRHAGSPSDHDTSPTESNMSATVSTPPSTKSQTKYSPIRFFLRHAGSPSHHDTSPTESNMSATVATPPSTKSQTKYSPIRFFLRHAGSPSHHDDDNDAGSLRNGLPVKPFRNLGVHNHENFAEMYEKVHYLQDWQTYPVCYMKIEKDEDTTLIVLRNHAGQPMLTLDAKNIVPVLYVLPAKVKTKRVNVLMKALVNDSIGVETIMLKVNSNNADNLVATVEEAIGTECKWN